MPNCNTVVLDVGCHLANPNRHRIPKGSHQYQRYLKMAKRYTGLEELEDALVPPPQPIVELVATMETDSTVGRTDSAAACDESAAVSAAASPFAASSADAFAASSTATCPSAAASADASTAAPNTACPSPAAGSAKGPSVSANEEECAGDASDEEEAGGSVSRDTESEEEFSETTNLSSTQYFTAKIPTSNRHRWLILFYEYLSRPTAGDKKQTIRLQHARQMRNLLEALDPAGDAILCLMNHEGDAVWRLWVKPHLNATTKKPGTIISYLTSYEKFLTLVTHERFNKKAPAIHPSYMKDFSNTLKDLKGWRSVVDNQSYDVKNQPIVDESEGLLTLEELNKIKSSSTYNQAERLLIQAGRGKDLDMKEFILVRDPPDQVLAGHRHPAWTVEQRHTEGVRRREGRGWQQGNAGGQAQMRPERTCHLSNAPATLQVHGDLRVENKARLCQTQ